MIKRDWSRYAPLGLIFAGLAAFLAICVYIVAPNLTIWLQICLIGIVFGLGLYAILAPSQLRIAVRGRRVRYGLNAVLMSFAFLGILVVINYLVFYNAKMNPEQTRKDLTEDKSNTLADETLDTLSKLPEVVNAQAFFSSRVDTGEASSLLETYAANAKGKFSFEFINWEEKRDVASKAGITNDGQIVLNMNDRKELVTSIDEQEMTSALVRLISGEKRVVYFLQDEGEYSPNGTDNNSMSKIRDALEDKNYSIETVKLTVDGMVPQDATMIVIAGPTQPLPKKSVDLLKEYLNNGGSLVVLVGPLVDGDTNAFLDDPLADYLVNDWGILLGNNVVITIEGNEPTMIAKAGAYGDHAITQKMGAYTPSFPLARSVQVFTSLSGYSQTEIVFTTSYYQNCFPSCSWATSDIMGLNAWYTGEQSKLPQSENDLVGPIPIAVAAENSTSEARVVIFGSSDFASDAYQIPGNQDLLINAIDWGAKQEALISLTPKESTERSLTPTVLQNSNVVTNLIFLGAIVLLPGSVLLAGVLAWNIRRRRG